MRSTRRRGYGRYVALALALLLLTYFGYYALYGDRGLLAQRRLERDVLATEEKLETLKTERDTLQRRTNGLRPESLDADLIEQQAREQLGLTREGEHVIVTPKAPPKRD